MSLQNKKATQRNPNYNRKIEKIYIFVLSYGLKLRRFSSLFTVMNRNYRKGFNMPAKVDAGKCTGCESCVDACPSEAIEMKNKKAFVVADKCVDCGVCVDECPVQAIDME